MDIRRSAWHFKFFTMGFDSGYDGEKASSRYSRYNLCSYFWRVVAGMLKVVCIVLVLLAIVVGAGSALYHYPLVFAGLALAVTAGVNAPRIFRRGSKQAQEPKEPKEPGLLRSYIQAKKDKVCPLIEFVE